MCAFGNLFGYIARIPRESKPKGKRFDHIPDQSIPGVQCKREARTLLLVSCCRSPGHPNTSFFIHAEAPCWAVTQICYPGVKTFTLVNLAKTHI
jgi:hypothetical protein